MRSTSPSASQPHSAKVERLGAGVMSDSLGTPIQEGDRVVYVAIFPCYHCHHCLRGDTNWYNI